MGFSSNKTINLPALYIHYSERQRRYFTLDTMYLTREAN